MTPCWWILWKVNIARSRTRYNRGVLPLPPSPSQAFVNELVTVGEFKWLAEWDNSTDKKGLLAKVPH